MRRVVLLIILAVMATSVAAQPDKVYKSLKDIKNPEKVYVLKLRYKRLKQVPQEVFKCVNLRELDLGCNFIDSIPPEIGELQNLEVLNLERNWLHTLPEEMGQLANLRRIDLNRNPLQELPPSMGALYNLERLVIWQTGVTELPLTFATLDGNLKILDMRECYLSEEQATAICEILPSVKKLWTISCNCR